MAQPVSRRAGNPKITKNNAGNQVISAGVSSTFNKNNGTASVNVRVRAIQQRNGDRPINFSTGHTTMKARIRSSVANHTCRNGNSNTYFTN